MNIVLSRLTLSLGLLAIALPALAGRPLQTEAAGVLEPGACEIEGVYERVRVDGASASSRGLAAACGIGLRSQLGGSGSWSKAGGERGRSAGLGGKTLLWTGSGDGAPAFTLAWGVDADRVDGH